MNNKIAKNKVKTDIYIEKIKNQMSIAKFSKINNKILKLSVTGI